MKAWVIGLLAVVLVGLGARTLLCSAEEPALVACSYDSAGSKPGGHLYMKLSQEEDGTVQVTLDAQNDWRAPKIQRTVEVPKEKLDELAAMFSRKDLLQWAKSPKSKEDVRDADTVRVTFRYTDKSEADFFDNQDLPKEAVDAMRKLHTFLREFFPDVQIKKRPSRFFCH